MNESKSQIDFDANLHRWKVIFKLFIDECTLNLMQKQNQRKTLYKKVNERVVEV